MNEVVVRTRSLRKRYRSGQAPVDALQGVDLEIHRGEVFCLLGPNGAGKTTLVRILATLLLPDGGEASVASFDVVCDPKEVRKHIGYAAQDSDRSAYPRLTVAENLYYFARALNGLSRQVAQKRLQGLAEALEFDEVLHREFGALSGGERQIVVVFRALLHEPSVCFLDEPSKSLDPLMARRMRKLIVDYVREHNAAAVLCTHNIKEAEDIADRVAVLRDGKIVFAGAPQDFVSAARVHDVIVLEGLETINERDLEKLRALPGIVSVESDRNGICLLAEDARQTLPDLLLVLPILGADVKLRINNPDLEETILNVISD